MLFLRTVFLTFALGTTASFADVYLDTGDSINVGGTTVHCGVNEPQPYVQCSCVAAGVSTGCGTIYRIEATATDLQTGDTLWRRTIDSTARCYQDCNDRISQLDICN